MNFQLKTLNILYSIFWTILLFPILSNSQTISFVESGQNFGNTRSFSIALGDIDGDGDTDAFITNYLGYNKVWLNDGKGTFTQSSQNIGSTTGHGAALGDLDRDGDLDIFLVNNESTDKVLFNDGTGIFIDSGQNLGNASDNGCHVSLGDIDNDGDLDAVVVNYLHPLKIWINDGHGFFSPGESFGGSACNRIALGDLDGDRDLDMFVTIMDGVDSIFFNDGSGHFTNSNQTLGPADGWGDVALGDIDNDGDLDAFATNSVHGNRVLINNGSGYFTEFESYFGGFGSAITLGDVEGDGDLDAFTSHLQQGNILWLNNGSGIFTSASQVLGTGGGATISLDDVDGDNDLDAFVGNHESVGTKLYFNESSNTNNNSDTISYQSGWNMISIPLDSMYLKTNLFPSSISGAYNYNLDSGKYLMKDTIEHRKGYWLKFLSAGRTSIIRDNVLVDTFNIKEGWNMIGSISRPVPATTIGSDPPGMIVSQFFTYIRNYAASDTIKPGVGYWVKAYQPCKLIFSISSAISVSHRIKIIPDGELPPAPPSSTSNDRQKPEKFVLHQNYPNPFNPTTEIKYELPTDANVKIELLNILGETLTTLVDEVQTAGSHWVSWNTSSQNKLSVSSGIYFYRIQAIVINNPHLQFTQVKKMVLLK